LSGTQRTTVHVADKAAPNDERAWRGLGISHEHNEARWFADHSIGYIRQATGGGKWPHEESDLGALSMQFPGQLFVSESVATSAPDTGTRWRFFAIDGMSERSLLTDGVWAFPCTLGLGKPVSGPNIRAASKAVEALTAARKAREAKGRRISAARRNTTQETETP
jgi:hypothetical protein